ncbi:MAG: hypothetical protein AVDCRST_MAG59-4666 [uncultured Thermomicrobiales bacterium]|uniref:Beta-lactamase-related domain-containing protein n=1 Tax=uncultured Thermomicrobiales bacterium TaxID=1645740 RepID=A0A6J4VKA0_9BACT|nr:MAG: hypothetical protein AVDCRST_MAG59-4666 [uncultured Thermomicrobiales bacterium]
MRRTLALVVLVLLVAGLPLPALAWQATPAASPAAGAPLPLDGERLATFEAYVAEMMAVLDVPGASIAVVQNGGVAYAQGFGVREIGRAKPVTADTLFMVGSVTKSFSSLLTATLVDAGELEWETPVADLLPGFAVADPALTTRLSVADAFCACTGVPRRDLELVFGFDDLTPEEMIASIAGFPLVAPLGEAFGYSNQVYAAGGYAAAIAAGAAPGDLLAGYRHALQQRVLGPIGMGRSALTLDEVFAAGDYALPHGAGLDGVVRPLSPLRDQRFADTVAPAGSLWSSAREMAAYLQTQLAGGVAPDGSRVVSAENLGRTWAPRAVVDGTEGAPPVIADAAQHYGMGWVTGEYAGRRLLSHSGSTLGFVSEVAFLPDDGLGIAILTNGSPGAGFFAYAVQFELLDLLFGRDSGLDPVLAGAVEAGEAEREALQGALEPVDPAAVAPFLGRYASAALGEVELTLVDGEVVLDAGEVRTALWPLPGDPGRFVAADAPMAGASATVLLGRGEGDRPEVVLEGSSTAGEGEATYVFRPIDGGGAAATPAA